jgi:AraC-like DNA-binding protein
MVIEYNTLNLKDLLQSISNTVKIPVINNRIDAPRNWIEAVWLPTGISLMLTEYELEQELLFQHHAGKEEQYFLWIDVASSESSAIVNIETGESLATGKKNNALLFSNHFNFSIRRVRGAKGFNICLFIPQELIRFFFKASDWENPLQWYFGLRSARLDMIKMTDAEKLMAEGIKEAVLKKQSYFDIERRIFQLLEIYFLRLHAVYGQRNLHQQITREEAVVLSSLDEQINNYYMEEVPDYKEMEHRTGMSRQALDKLVKKAFNESLADYIKQVKMHKAYCWLAAGHKEVKDIAYELGYANPSNFSAAFKKQYGVNPSEVKMNQPENSKAASL